MVGIPTLVAGLFQNSSFYYTVPAPQLTAVSRYFSHFFPKLAVEKEVILGMYWFSPAAYFINIIF